MLGPEPDDSPTQKQQDANDSRAILCGLPDAVTIVIADVAVELLKALKKHPGKMHGPHEGLGVIYEEFREFADEVKNDDRAAQRKEAKQVAAMGARFLLDVE